MAKAAERLNGHICSTLKAGVGLPDHMCPLYLGKCQVYNQKLKIRESNFDKEGRVNQEEE